MRTLSEKEVEIVAGGSFRLNLSRLYMAVRIQDAERLTQIAAGRGGAQGGEPQLLRP